MLGALPAEIEAGPTARRTIAREGQVRLHWDATPVDLFFSTTRFHDDAAKRVRHELFGGSLIPFLACGDLAVFKAFFNRLQDWADLERMVAARSFDIQTAAETLARYVGADDPRVIRLRGF